MGMLNKFIHLPVKTMVSCCEILVVLGAIITKSKNQLRGIVEKNADQIIRLSLY